jgi:hypothetical protein
MHKRTSWMGFSSEWSLIFAQYSCWLCNRLACSRTPRSLRMLTIADWCVHAAWSINTCWPEEQMLL